MKGRSLDSIISAAFRLIDLNILICQTKIMMLIMLWSKTIWIILQIARMLALSFFVVILWVPIRLTSIITRLASTGLKVSAIFDFMCVHSSILFLYLVTNRNQPARLKIRQRRTASHSICAIRQFDTQVLNTKWF